VKQQADIVRVVGNTSAEEERQNFTGCVPFTRKVAVVCGASDEADLSLLGCGVGGDVFKFVIGDGEVHVSRGDSNSLQKNAASPFRGKKERSPEGEKRISSELCWSRCNHEAQTFFVKQVEGRWKGKRPERISKCG